MAGSSSSIRPANGRTKFPVSGPHFGKALDTVIKDRLDVALWFLKDRERCAAHPDIANYLVHATKGRVNDSKTPRHNRAQLDFLERPFLNAFMERVMDDSEWFGSGWIGSGYAERADIRAVPESMFGWDLYIDYGCHCGDPDCDSEYHAGAGTVAVEIKPIISDKREIKGKVIEDPASILRQINRQRNVTGARSVVLYAEEINCASATRLEIERYFDASGVRLITLGDVAQTLVNGMDWVDILAHGDSDAYNKLRWAAKFAHDLAFECAEICFDGINSNVDMYKFARLVEAEDCKKFFVGVPHAFIHYFVKDAIDHRGDRRFRWLDQHGHADVNYFAHSLPEVSRAMSNILLGIV